MPEKPALIESDFHERQRISFGELWKRVKISAAGIAENGIKSGDRCMLCFQQGIELMITFLACNYLGAIPIPLEKPNKNLNYDMWDNIASDAGITCVIVSRDDTYTVNRLKDRGAFRGIPMFHVSSSFAHKEEGESDTCFLQYTSGSTGNPKGVTISNKSITSQLKVLVKIYGFNIESIMVNWLPFVHDTGLIMGMLLGIYSGFTSVILNPQITVSNPINWAKAIYHYGATHTAAPNFAYDLLADVLGTCEAEEPYLATLEKAINAGEPNHFQTFEHFYRIGKKFGVKENALIPAYGMAEATLMICSYMIGDKVKWLQVEANEIKNQKIKVLKEGRFRIDSALKEDAVYILSCGRNVPGHTIVIRGDDGKRKECLQIGEICVEGQSLADGYWGKKEQTNKVYKLNENKQIYLRTGDLGFLDVEGYLYITGRIKDMIIIHGTNIYSQDLERLSSDSSPDCILDSAAAFAVLDKDHNECVVIVQEVKTDDKKELEITGTAIQKNILSKYGISAKSIMFIKKGSLLKTPSGKIQRSKMKESYLQGKMEGMLYEYNCSDNEDEFIVDRNDKSAILKQIRRIIASVLKITETSIDAGEPLMQLGVSSLLLLRVCEKLNYQFKLNLSVTTIFNYNTVNKLGNYIWNLSNNMKENCRKDENEVLDNCTPEQLLQLLREELGERAYGN